MYIVMTYTKPYVGLSIHVYVTRKYGTGTIVELRRQKAAPFRNSYMVQQFRNCAGLQPVIGEVGNDVLIGSTK